MRFQIFGGSDCPDHVLSQLAGLGQLSAMQVEAVAEYVIDHLAMNPVDLIGPESTNAMIDARDALLSLDCFADNDHEFPFLVSQAACALHCLLRNTARYAVPIEIATKEFTLLGIEPAVCESLCRQYQPQAAAILGRLSAEVPLLSGVVPVEVDASGTTTSEEATATIWYRGNPDGQEEADQEPEIHLALNATVLNGRAVVKLSGSPSLHLSMSPEKLRALLAELVAARESLKEPIR